MNKENVLEVFNELLEAWDESESIVIRDRGNFDDYNLLDRDKKEYQKRFLEALRLDNNL